MRGATGRWTWAPFPSNSEDRPGTPSKRGLGLGTHERAGHRHCGLWHSQALQSPHCRIALVAQPTAVQVGCIQPVASKTASKFELSGVPGFQSRGGAERVSVTVGRQLRRRGGSQWAGGGFRRAIGLSRADDDGRCRWGTGAAVAGNTGIGVGIGGSWCSTVVPRLNGWWERSTRSRAPEVIEPSWRPPEDIGEVQWGEDQARGCSGDELRSAGGEGEQLRGIGPPFGMGVYPFRTRPTCPLWSPQPAPLSNWA